MPSSLNTKGEEYLAIFGDEDFTPNDPITESADYQCGAIANELEYLRGFIDRLIESLDVDQATGDYLEKMISFMINIERIYSEADSALLNRFHAFIRRDPRWMTKWSILDAFGYFFDPSDLHLIENYIESSDIVNGDFEIWSSGMFDDWTKSESNNSRLMRSAPRIEGSWGCGFFVDARNNPVTIYQTISSVTIGDYKFSVLVVDDGLSPLASILYVAFQRSSDSFYYDASDDTWKSGIQENNLAAVGPTRTEYRSEYMKNEGTENITVTIGNAEGVQIPDKIFAAYSNLMTNPEDISAWTGSNASATLEDLFARGVRLSKITLSGANGYMWEAATFTGDAIKTLCVVLVKGTDTACSIILRDTTAPADRLDIKVTWSGKVITETTGSVFHYEWFENDTVVVLYCLTTSVTAANTNRVWLEGLGNGKTFFASGILAEDSVFPVPYAETSHTPAAYNDTYTMPSKFTLDVIVDPWFNFDTPTNKTIVSWKVDATHWFIILYSIGSDKFQIWWQDGGNLRILETPPFDDGSSYTDINQRIRIVASIDLTTGDTSGSRFIVVPLESGSATEDSIWSGAIDAHVSNFPTLNAGHAASANYADSIIERIRVYNGNTSATITDDDEADAALLPMSLLHEVVIGVDHEVHIDLAKFGDWKTYPSLKVLILAEAAYGGYANLFPVGADPLGGGENYDYASFIDQSYIPGVGGEYVEQTYDDFLDRIKPAGAKSIVEFVESSI